MIETSHKEKSTTCINLETLTDVSNYLEKRYIEKQFYLGEIESFLNGCSEFFVKLSPKQIKQELYPDLQLYNSNDLKNSGGIIFDYENTTTVSGFLPNLQLENVTSGPKRRILVVYDLESKEVILFNYSGANDVYDKEREFPLLKFLKEGFKLAAKAFVP